MKTAEYTDLARQAWEEAAPIHWSTTRRLLDEIKDPNRCNLHPVYIAELKRAGLDGAAVAHINCNNGTELISIKRLGAGRCVGFDVAEGFTQQAQELAAAAEVACEFLCSDAYRIPETYDATFDIVTVTAGAIWFMPDLPAYFAVVRHLLKPGGRFVLYESHPITTMLSLDRDTQNKSFELMRSYFDRTPRRHETGLDYQGGSTYAAKPVYKFAHRLDEILQDLIDTGDGIGTGAEHPSQAIGDLLTIKDVAGRLDNLVCILTGEIHSRAARSLIFALSKFDGNRLILHFPLGFGLSPEEMAAADGGRGIIRAVADFRDILATADVLYHCGTRPSPETYDPAAYALTAACVRNMRPDASLMHPLPRHDRDLSEALDRLPQARFLEQAHNGLYARMAILSHLLGAARMAPGETAASRTASGAT